MRPPFHADQVGSLLRPADLREARERHKKGARRAQACAPWRTHASAARSQKEEIASRP